MPGEVTAIAAWMLDPVACAGMATIDAPRVTVSALLELHHLLSERGFRGSSRDDHTTVQGEQYAEAARAGPIVHGPAPTQHGARFGEAAKYEPLRTQRRSGAEKRHSRQPGLPLVLRGHHRQPPDR